MSSTKPTNPYCLLIILVHLFNETFSAPAPIIIVIQTQPGIFHSSLAEKSQESILKQWKKYVPSHVMDPPKILLTHELEGGVAESAWTLFPLVEVLCSHLEEEPSIEWVAVLGETTHLDLKNLNLAVEKYKFNPTESPLFLGRALKDEDTTIVHHYDPPGKMLYPDLEAGIFLSRKLLLTLKESLSTPSPLFPQDFNIDPAYEFAKYLYRDGDGVSLENIDEICGSQTSSYKCFATARPQVTSCLKSSQSSEMKSVLDKTLVTVKTCSKFHKDRLNVVKETWAPMVPNILFVSDEEDLDIPTVHLPYTVNTESGHCNKTMAIIQHFLDQEKEKELLVIADDDTVLSVARLASLLACYEGDSGPLFLGQKYGYGVANGGGYSYVTGGGGMVLNRAGARVMASCPCPKEDTPDDMHLGICARRGGVWVTHSSRMFQARPPDYPQQLIKHRKPVSFHKHWEIDPIKVYKEYFEKLDSKLRGPFKDEL